MPVYFQKPENALKRANEFIDVGKKDAALDILYDVIKSKKHRTWQKIHEPILQKYLSLCVDLKRSVNAKEGLYQYKLICQQVNIVSLEEVISFFLKLADSMADDARNQSIEQVAVEDLDMVQTPEGIMLSSVSAEDAQDRSDRLLLTPWVKFLWEAYRNVLELLRNNNRLERLYHDTAQDAFKFCLKYKRRAEFRKLCNLIKNHLDQVLKYQAQPTSVNLNAPESLQMNLETRLFQLESAISMELWQEAFRAIEGIHYLMSLSKKPPKPHMMANYYDKVALVFLKAGNYLFHSAALLKLFTITKEHKKSATAEELQDLASRVILAVLSIEIAPGQSAMEAHLNFNATQHDKDLKLTQILGLYQVPTRKSMAKDIIAVMPHASKESVELFNTIENQFQPTKLCKKVGEIIGELASDVKIQVYVESVQKTAVLRMLKQVSQLYETMHFDKLLSLVPFADEFTLQRSIVEGVKDGTIQVTLDHRQKSISFGSALVVAMKEEIPEGPHIQAMPSEILRNQLVSLSEGLSNLMPDILGEAKEQEANHARDSIVQQYIRSERKEHAQTLNRKSTIEARKEQLESLRTEQERYERNRINQQQQKLKVAEEQRLKEEQEKREKERRLAEMKEIQKQQVWDRVTLLRETDTGKKAFKYLTAEEIDEMDPEEILIKQAEQMDREKRDLQTKLKTQEKKIDHFVRATRLVEIPKLKAYYEEVSVLDKQVWDQEEAKRIDNAEKEHQAALKMKSRFVGMQEDKQMFLDKLFGNRHAEYEAKVADFDAMVERVRAERLEERRKQRMAQRRKEFILAQREEKKKKMEEIRKREEEIERRRLEKEAEERRQREAEEELKREEIENKKRAKEAEIEAREAERRQQQQPQKSFNDPSRSQASAPAPTKSGGGYIPPHLRRAMQEQQSQERKDEGPSSDGGEGGWRRGGGADRSENRGDSGNRWGSNDGARDYNSRQQSDDRGGDNQRSGWGSGGGSNTWGNKGNDGSGDPQRSGWGNRDGGSSGGGWGNRGSSDTGADRGGESRGWGGSRDNSNSGNAWGNRGGESGGANAWGNRNAGGGNSSGNAWGNRDSGERPAWGSNRESGGSRGDAPRSYQASRVSRD